MDAGTETPHGREVARLLRKVARRGAILAGVTLGLGMLLPLPLYVRFREPAVLYLGGLLDIIVLGFLAVLFFDRVRPLRLRLKESLGRPPSVAFHCKGGYFFINELGVFSERTLSFIPFWGLTSVRALRFDAEARRLTLFIHSYRGQPAELRIDVPPGVFVEPLTRLSAASPEGTARGALARPSAGAR